MVEVTVKMLSKQLNKLVKEGCGDKKILITSDDEANEYHRVWYGAGDIEEDEKEYLKCSIYDPEVSNNLDEYIIIS